MTLIRSDSCPAVFHSAWHGCSCALPQWHSEVTELEWEATSSAKERGATDPDRRQGCCRCQAGSLRFFVTFLVSSRCPWVSAPLRARGSRKWGVWTNRKYPHSAVTWGKPCGSCLGDWVNGKGSGLPPTPTWPKFRGSVVPISEQSPSPCCGPQGSSDLAPTALSVSSLLCISSSHLTGTTLLPVHTKHSP